MIVGGEGDDRWIGGFDRQVRAVVLSPLVRQRLTMLVSKPRSGDLERLAEFISAGKVKPVIDRQKTLDAVPEAIRYVAPGHARGKVLITV